MISFIKGSLKTKGQMGRKEERRERGREEGRRKEEVRGKGEEEKNWSPQNAFHCYQTSLPSSPPPQSLP